MIQLDIQYHNHFMLGHEKRIPEEVCSIINSTLKAQPHQVKTTVSSIAPKLWVIFDVSTASTFSSRWRLGSYMGTCRHVAQKAFASECVCTCNLHNTHSFDVIKHTCMKRVGEYTRPSCEAEHELYTYVYS